MITARLQSIPACPWSGINVVGISHWLWVDTDAGGLHLESRLGCAPAEVTHVWGWDDAGTRLVRLRVDRDLGATGELWAVGALLDLSDAGSGEQVDVERLDGQVWNPADGRINADPSHRVFTGNRLATIYTAHRETVTSSGELIQSPLTFVVLNARAT